MRSKDPELMEKIKEFAEEYALENSGATPSTREIGRALGFTHVCAYKYLVAMDAKGMIRYVDGKIHTEKIDKIACETEMSPTFPDTIPAGPAEEIDAQVESYISIPSLFTDGKGGKYYVLKVSGESMIDAGIENGDLIVVRQDIEPKENDIVVALIDNRENTLKRYLRDDKGAYLWAENETWSDEKRFYGRNFTVQGVAVKVVKDPQ